MPFCKAACVSCAVSLVCNRAEIFVLVVVALVIHFTAGFSWLEQDQSHPFSRAGVLRICLSFPVLSVDFSRTPACEEWSLKSLSVFCFFFFSSGWPFPGIQHEVCIPWRFALMPFTFSGPLVPVSHEVTLGSPTLSFFFLVSTWKRPMG